MLEALHLTQLAEVRPLADAECRATLLAAALLFAAAFGLRLLDSNVGDAEGALFIVPIIVLSLRFGLRGSLGGSFVALSLVFVWSQVVPGVQLLTTGYLVRATTLSVVADLGTFVERRRVLEAGILRYYDATLDLLATGGLTGAHPREPRLAAHAGALAADDVLQALPRLRASRGPQGDARADARPREGRRDARVPQPLPRLRRRLPLVGVERPSLGDDDVVHAVARDVTAQHEAEHQLADNARSLELMIAERTRELDEARAETLRQLAIAAEYRDDETYQHTERVGHVAARLALGLRPARRTGHAATPGRAAARRGQARHPGSRLNQDRGVDRPRRSNDRGQPTTPTVSPVVST